MTETNTEAIHKQLTEEICQVRNDFGALEAALNVVRDKYDFNEGDLWLEDALRSAETIAIGAIAQKYILR